MTQPQDDAGVPKMDVVLPPSADGSSFDIYRAASAPQVEVTLPEGRRAEDFFIDAANYQLPRAVVSRARTCAVNIRRGPAEIAQDVTPTVHLYFHVAGESRFIADGASAHCGPGDVIVVDSQLAYESSATDFEVRIVMVPRDRVPPIFLSPGVHGLRLPGEAAGTRLLAATMEALLREIEGLSVSEADHAVLAICQLAAAPIATQLTHRGGDQSAWDQPSLESAMAYIGHRLKDADLSPDDVRVHLGMSRSAIYRLFAPFGGIESAIRAQRLDEAMRAILARETPRLGLKALAARHGFRSETNFARAFQARFGAGPSLVRSKVKARDKAWQTAQAKRAGFSSLEAWLHALAAGIHAAEDE